MAVTIQSRPYGPESSGEETQAIKARLHQVAPTKFQWDEMPIQSPYSVQTMIEAIKERTAAIPQWDLVVDLRSAGPPSQEVRAALFAALKQVPGLHKCACVTGRNFLMNVAAKFIFSSLSIPVTVHKTMEEGLREIGHDGNA